MSPILLSLVGMVCWGIGPILAKFGLSSINPVIGLCIRTMTAGIVVSGFSMSEPYAHTIVLLTPRQIFFLTVEALFATVVGDLAYYAAVKKGKCGETSIILSASPIITILLSYIMIGEKLTVGSAAGTALVVLGLVLVNLEK